MKISTLIDMLQEIEKDKGGDIECFSMDLFEMAAPVVVNAAAFPCAEEYNMPDTFVILKDYR